LKAHAPANRQEPDSGRRREALAHERSMRRHDAARAGRRRTTGTGDDARTRRASIHRGVLTGIWRSGNITEGYRPCRLPRLSLRIAETTRAARNPGITAAGASAARRSPLGRIHQGAAAVDRGRCLPSTSPASSLRRGRAGVAISRAGRPAIGCVALRARGTPVVGDPCVTCVELGHETPGSPRSRRTKKGEK